MGATRIISLKVHFENRAAAASCLQGLREIPGTSLNVVRGRVTPDEVNYDIEITGGGRLVKRAIRNLPFYALAELKEA